MASIVENTKNIHFDNEIGHVLSKQDVWQPNTHPSFELLPRTRGTIYFSPRQPRIYPFLNALHTPGSSVHTIATVTRRHKYRLSGRRTRAGGCGRECRPFLHCTLAQVLPEGVSRCARVSFLNYFPVDIYTLLNVDRIYSVMAVGTRRRCRPTQRCNGGTPHPVHTAQQRTPTPHHHRHRHARRTLAHTRVRFHSYPRTWRRRRRRCGASLSTP